MASTDEFERAYGDIIKNMFDRYIKELGIVTWSPVIVKAINGTNITVHFAGDDPTKTFIVSNVTGQTLLINQKVSLIIYDTTATNSFIGFTK